jgi:hypothetical protein
MADHFEFQRESSEYVEKKIVRELCGVELEKGQKENPEAERTSPHVQVTPPARLSSIYNSAKVGGSVSSHFESSTHPWFSSLLPTYPS